MNLSRDEYRHWQEKQKYLEPQVRQPGGDAIKPSPMAEAVAALEEGQQALSDLLAQLTSALSPILRPAATEEPPGANRIMSPGSPLSETLARAASLTRQHCEHVSRLLHSLTL